MKIWNIVKKLFKSTCVYFTLISVFFLFLGWLDGAQSASSSFEASAFYFIPFGFCMALGQELLCAKSLSRPVRYLGHYAVTMLTILIFLVLAAEYPFQFTTLILLFVIFSVLYWIVFGIAALILGRVKKLMEEN